MLNLQFISHSHFIRLLFLAEGVNRLVGWTEGQKAVWNCIECTHINNLQKKATPQQVRAEV